MRKHVRGDPGVGGKESRCNVSKKTKEKMTPAQKEWRRRERSAAKKNAKVAATIPLFADQVEKRTAQSEYWHWRRNVAMSFERGSKSGVGTTLGVALDLIQLQAIERTARSVMPELFDELNARVRKTYPSSDYWRRVWIDILCGKEVPCRMRWNFPLYPPRVIHEPMYPDWVAPFTKDQLDTMFPFIGPSVPPVTPDDGGLAELLAAVFDRSLDRAGNIEAKEVGDREEEKGSDA